MMGVLSLLRMGWLLLILVGDYLVRCSAVSCMWLVFLVSFYCYCCPVGWFVGGVFSVVLLCSGGEVV